MIILIHEPSSRTPWLEGGQMKITIYLVKIIFKFVKAFTVISLISIQSNTIVLLYFLHIFTNSFYFHLYYFFRLYQTVFA